LFWFGFMVFSATFNNISAISWRSVLLVEETGVPRENYRPVESHWLYHIMLCKTYSLESLSRFPVPTRDSLQDDIKTTFEEVEEKVDNNLYYCSLFTPITVCDIQGSSWPWSYGSWIYKYLYNQCLSPLKLWFRIPLMVRCTLYNIMW
jgi:hypothetical protein